MHYDLASSCTVATPGCTGIDGNCIVCCINSVLLCQGEIILSGSGSKEIWIQIPLGPAVV